VKVNFAGKDLPARLQWLFWLAVVFVFSLPVPAAGQPTFVQVNNNTVATNSASVSVAYAAPETAGDLNVVVVVGWNDTTSSVTSVADDNTNNYVLVGTTAGHGLSQAIYYARNIVLPNNTTPTVTVTFNQTAGFSRRSHSRIQRAEYDCAAGQLGRKPRPFHLR